MKATRLATRLVLLEANPKEYSNAALVHNTGSIQCNHYLWWHIKRVSTKFFKYVGSYSYLNQVVVNEDYKLLIDFL